MKLVRVVLGFSLVLAGCSQTTEPNNAVSTSVGSKPSTPVAPPPIAKPTYDGPFGLRGGLSLAEVQAVVTLGDTDTPGLYSSASVPAPHPAFSSYILFISETVGLCFVQGLGKDVESGSYGSEVQAEFKLLEEALMKKYGRRKKYDFATGIMDAPEYWMLALREKDRHLSAYWDSEEKSTLPSGISAISLNASALDLSTGYITLKYEFPNMKECALEQAAARDKSL